MALILLDECDRIDHFEAGPFYDALAEPHCLLGMSCYDLHAPSDAQSVAEILKRVRKTGRPESFFCKMYFCGRSVNRCLCYMPYDGRRVLVWSRVIK